MYLESKYRTLTSILKKQHINNLVGIEACFMLLSYADKINQACAKKLGEHQLSESRFMILTLLLEYDVLSSKKIATLCGVTKPTMTSLIHSLLKDELVYKNKTSQDGRQVDIKLTEKGKKLIMNLFQDHISWIESITKQFSVLELETLTNLLNKITVSKN
ncbi:MarR family winged helix-turn-helix transcriptional regulator [Thorsellia kenyensis]|uniref:MarR family winged helix-turn-helix transcriptional regulator n=1 Tax=Thorsellia kenyensis TaxID=1549888 RepID=A0ABV6C8Z9_9GAMM